MCSQTMTLLFKISAESSLLDYYNQAQIKVMKGSQNSYYAGITLGRQPRDNEVGFHFIVTTGTAGKFRQWYDGLSIREKLLFVRIDNEQELYELVETGQIRDLVGWCNKQGFAPILIEAGLVGC